MRSVTLSAQSPTMIGVSKAGVYHKRWEEVTQLAHYSTYFLVSFVEKVHLLKDQGIEGKEKLTKKRTEASTYQT